MLSSTSRTRSWSLAANRFRAPSIELISPSVDRCEGTEIHTQATASVELLWAKFSQPSSSSRSSIRRPTG